MSEPGRAQQGFTLIELLVAVMIFALLSLAGVLLLRGSVVAQAAVSVRLDEMAEVQRGMATLDADLGQATTRITRTQTGTLAPAFFGRTAQADEPILQFVRGGWSNPGNQTRASIQKVEYWWRDGRIERIGYTMPDGSAPGPAGTLFTDVAELRLRYRDRQGEWKEIWSPATPQEMPALVELEIIRAKGAPLTLRFLVGPGGRAPDVTTPPGPEANGRPRTDPTKING